MTSLPSRSEYVTGLPSLANRNCVVADSSRRSAIGPASAPEPMITVPSGAITYMLPDSPGAKTSRMVSTAR